MSTDEPVDSYMPVAEIRARLEELNKQPGSLFYGVLDKIRSEQKEQHGKRSGPS